MDLKNKITKEKLIKIIAEAEHENIQTIRSFYNTFEQTIKSLLSSVEPDNSITIKLFEGISLDGVYVPEKSKKNNLTGEMSVVAGKIKPKFNITRSYCEKLNNKE